MTRTDWSVAVSKLTPEQRREALIEDGYHTLAARLVRRHHLRLAAGAERKVIVLSDYRKAGA